MKYVGIIIFFFSSLFSQYEIEGRWHLVGYEDVVMYQFVDTEPFADAGYRYTIYSIDGIFGGLEDAGGSPNPYLIEDDIITINLFFGQVPSYQMNSRCDGQVLEFINIEYDAIQSILFREGYNFIDNECEEHGDINYDGQVDITDVVLLVSYILDGLIDNNGDINQDESVDILDVILLVDLIL
tara:strand:+ start:451 stop:999 length:549 start_codon:yes stop_codon:yes gene_type:complete